MSWRFIHPAALELLHEESLAEHGGRPGLKDEGLLASALARPRQLLADGETDVAALAAACGVTLARQPAFVDGNVRTALLATGLFLAINGHRWVISQAEATLTLLALASGDLSEAEFADSLRRHTHRQT